VPTVTRARTISAGGDEVWAVVSDPAHLPRWWPDVVRVEEATTEAWTQVLGTGTGKTLRADFTRVDAEPGRHLVWRQELEETPFERLLSEAVTEVTLEPSDAGSTRVELRTRQRPRGLARLGGFMFRRAARRKLDEALDGLERVLGP
jgi:uncharacterized protein YndB with AHSA1/START domain